VTDADGHNFLGFRVGSLEAPIVQKPGDFNRNGQLDAGDIDYLSAQLRAGSTDRSLDLNADGAATFQDHDFWITKLANTYPGDTNLDGQFNSSDLVFAFLPGQYEDTIPLNSNWIDGDWSGDSEFNSADFVYAFQAGGYEMGPRTAISPVPEPASVGLLLSGLVMLSRFRKR
jgi:hypothetical protein